MSLRRIALLDAALFVLAVAVFVAGARYPDEEYGLTLNQAQRVDEIRARDGSQFAIRVSEDGARPFAASYLHNFPARARLTGGAALAALLLTAMAFGRKHDRAPPVPA